MANTVGKELLEAEREEKGESEERKMQVEKVKVAKVETQRKEEEDYKVLVESMVQEIYKLSPEWEARKLRLEQVR